MKPCVKRLLILIASFAVAYSTSSFAKPLSCKAPGFDSKQILVLKKSFAYGKPFDLGYTLAAIAWQESLAGRYLINVNDPSFGVYHILISSAANRSNIKGIEVNRLAMAIMSDQRLSASYAIKELMFWRKTLKEEDRTWNNVWAAYNGGYNFKSSKAQEYSNSISNKIEWLKRCLIK